MNREVFFSGVWVLVFVLVLSPSFASAQADPALEVGRFSSEVPGKDFPAQWEILTFPNKERHTAYELIEEDGETVVRATSEASASGLIRKITIDPQEYPRIRWRWKATEILKKGDLTRKDGDDYSARIYITFHADMDSLGFWEKTRHLAAKLLYGQAPPAAAINYIWAGREPVETMAPNPYSDRVMMFVVDSGKDNLNTWQTHERNIYRDYRAAFGQEPPPISGVAIMTDTDDTGESAVTYYGDIVFLREKD